MPQPKLATFPQIRGALRFYQICSVITGVGLLLLVAEMILKYTPLHVELFLGGSGGFLWFADVIAQDCVWYSQFVPGSTACEMISTGDGINLSLGILIVHGWFYVVYLFACFRVWSLMRWPFGRFILLAGGGVIPFLSFFMEVRVARDVKRYLAEREAAAAEKAAAKAASPQEVAS
ncbi:DUF3817 domain-containing protein [Microbacterium sp. MEC084]|jgi:hypothetical protein|uniref:DUF3817 domain-containing protein n=1 Tax=Microbacterium sp. MEC084 TaxID=1963027 RepID=UPI00106F9D90|nr:DUF3817 domain-containing protein [Microbacterium sp. MEC084]MCD1269255.1 DUF3817 domain-containing protein [Microbacterium sp. MEC084]